MSITEVQQATAAEQPQPSKLRLPSLEIRNFRAFEHLEVERLGRVNLITGRNNVGKTSLLEAVYLYGHPEIGQAFRELMIARDEITGQVEDPYKEGSAYLVTTRHLFYGREEQDTRTNRITIGPMNDAAENLRISVGSGESSTQRPDLSQIVIKEPSFNAQQGKSSRYGTLRPVTALGAVSDRQGPVLLRSSGLSVAELAHYWSRIELSSLEDEVVDALKLVAPHVERIGVKSANGRSQSQVPIARISESSQPVPLRTLGDGMVRLFGLALALANARESFLLIDEVENGLHYSIQPDVWRLIFRLAGRLNVQVFATTHSWDCIEAFQKAAEENQEEDGVLVRLRDEMGKIQATCFNERHLAVVTREHLEVR